MENCKPQDEITSFLDNLYILLLVKESYYNSTNYDGKVVGQRVKEYYTRIFVDHNTQSEGRILVTREFLDSDDNLFNLGIFSEQFEFYTMSKDLKITEYHKETDEK